MRPSIYLSSASRVRRGVMSLSSFIDKLWDMFSGRLFLVRLEHVTKPPQNWLLRERLVPVVGEFHTALDDVMAELLPPRSARRPRRRNDLQRDY